MKDRYLKVILYLLDINYPVTIQKISQQTGVNRNTLKKEIDAVGKYLLNWNIKLIRKPRKGIYIVGKPKDKERLRVNLLNSRSKEKIPYKNEIFLIKTFLVSDNLPTVEDFCEILSVSRPTVIKYVKKARNWLKKRNIVIYGKPGVGYKLVAREENIRDAIFDFISEFEESSFNELMEIILSKNAEGISSFDLGVLNNIEISDIKRFVDNIEIKTNTTLTDKDYVGFIVKIAISLQRIKHKHFVKFDPKMLFNIMQNPIYKIIANHVYIIEAKHDVRFYQGEIGYLTLLFISSKLRKTSMLNISKLDNVKEDKYIRYANQVAEIAEDIFGLPLEKDDEFIHMLALHLKSSFNKLKYGINFENPLLDEIRNEYPLAYSIAERIAIMLGKRLKIKIPPEEAGYIAMYIAMAVEKIKHQRRKRKKIAVVCAMAMGTSSLLFWRLLNEMPDIDVVQVSSYKEVIEGKIDLDIDLIVSTIPLPKLSVPHIVVSPFLNSSERQKIRDILGISKRNWNNLSIVEIEDILNKNLTFQDVIVHDYKEVIKLLGKALIVNGYVKKGFIRAVLNREKRFPTGLRTHIPISVPHAGSDYTLRRGVAIAILKKPVEFYEMGNPKEKINVRIVLMPVLTANNKENAFFFELLKKCRDEKIANKLLNAKNFSEVKQILLK